MVRKLKLVGLLGVLIATGASPAVAGAASSPTVATGGTSSVTTSSAVVKGAVNPDGATTSYHFDFGLTTADGTSSPVRSAGHGTKSVSVTRGFSSLLPGTVYHYRLVASNRFGATAGADRSFRTHGNPPPELATGGSQVTSASTAVVTGVVNPHGDPASYQFQYGPITAPTATFPFTPAQTLPGGRSAVPVSATLVGLTPGTSFEYRLVVQRLGLAPQYGAFESFLTYPSPRPVPRVRARTTPRRDRHRPFEFITSGRVVGPSTLPTSVSCYQNVVIRFRLGRRVVASELATVLPDCTFSAPTTFQHMPGRGPRHRTVQLRVSIHFRGNGYLAPSDAKPERVTLG